MSTDQLSMVKIFMLTFGQTCRHYTTIPPETERLQRAKLLLEETLETIEALGFRVNANGNLKACCNPDLRKIPDGLADLEYVVKGTYITCGIENDLDIFEEIHKSNISKFWTREETEGLAANLTVNKYDGDRYIVTDDSGKVIKPPSFKSPDLDPYLDSYL